LLLNNKKTLPVYTRQGNAKMVKKMIKKFFVSRAMCRNKNQEKANLSFEPPD